MFKVLTLVILLGSVSLLACSTGRQTASSASHEIEFIRCGRLVDVMSGEARSNIDLIVSPDGRIESMGAGLTPPQGAQVIDLSEYTVLPGLIDMHAHLMAAPEDEADLKGHFFASHEAILKRGERNAKATLLAGFTTVRDLGTYHGWANRDLRDEINQGKVQGPRMQVAPYYLTIPHGGGDAFLPGVPDSEIPAHLRLGVARNVEEFRARAEAAVRGGADLLKIIASGAVLAPGGVPGKPEMTFAEIKAVVQVAHQAGLKVAAHAHGAQSIKDSIRAGVDTIEHASLIDDEGIRLAKKKKAALSMDVYDGDYIDVEGVKQKWPQEFLESNLKITEIQRKNFTKAYKAGVTMVFGTDSGVYPHGDNAKQFGVMVQRGMTPIDAIRAATSTAAKYMGWDQDIGSIAVGHFADLVAVKGDPLADIRLLEKIQLVMKNGQIVN